MAFNAADRNRIAGMKARTLISAVGVVAAAVAMAIPAHADPDTDFVNELHTFGIYGPKDYNAWIGKITCQRMRNNIDPSVNESASFVNKNIPRGSSEQQVYQFINASIDTYCPDEHGRLAALAQPS
jgi:hypothetical protein